MHERPHIRKGLASAAFDDEGAATHDRELVENGILQGYVLGSYSARRLGLKTTGNAGGIHNLVVEASGIQIPGHVVGGHVGQQPAELLLAVACVHFRPVDEHLLGGGIRWYVVRPDTAEKARITAQRGHGGPDAPRVEADDVAEVSGHAWADALRHLKSAQSSSLNDKYILLLK